ncbi:MAG: B12-binding domain-containing radical SAM protein [Candidatus Anammoxibacter sp.]
MNILMIYPETPVTFWSYKYALNLFGIKSLLQPLGLQTVAALLPPDWEKRLIDLNITELSDSDLEWADYVFISAMIVQKESVYKIIARCKTFRINIVAGGPLFTNELDQFEEVDHFVLNEGELTLPLFISDIENGTPKRVYTSSEFADIEKSPVPQWDMVDLEQYALMGIQYSRGCPYKCEFCNITTLLGNRTRVKTAEQIIDELDSLYNAGWRRGVFFVDDNFIGNKKRLKTELLPLLIEWHKDKQEIRFRTQASIDLADDDQLMELMVEAGFGTVFIGIETPDEKSLAECAKTQNKSRNLAENIKHIHQSGLQVEGGFIVGFDSDTESIFQRQIDFIQQSGTVTAMVGMLQALPGTKLHDRLEREGRLLEQSSGDNVDGTTNIMPKMGLDTLVEGHRKILKYIYSPENHYQRVITFLSDFHSPAKSVTQKFELKKFLSLNRYLFRVIYRLGIVDNGRKYFWKILLWSLIHRRELFFMALFQAVSGYHFNKISKLNTANDK